MNGNAQHLTRGVLVFFAALLALSLLQLGIDLWLQEVPLARVLQFPPEQARHLNNLFNRSFNQLLAIVLTMVALAVPLTANMYSLKFLEFFVKDPVNAAALGLVVLANWSNSAWGAAIRDGFTPYVGIQFSSLLMALCFALVVPYLYYVFRFLHPNTLLARLEGGFRGELAACVDGRAGKAGRRRLAEAIEHLGNIGTRSIERGDRNTAIESALALERLLHDYWQHKQRLADAWFVADPAVFLGYSPRALDELSDSRAWVEMKILSEARQLLGSAVGKLPEVVSSVAEVMRRTATAQATQADPALRQLVTEYFNTCIRLAINRKDPRAVFILFDQYRQFAEALLAHDAELVEEIAYYFEYYGQVARDAGLPFVVEAVAHDLGALVQNVWQTGHAIRHALLERFLNYDRLSKATLPGVRRAQAILASYFLLHGEQGPVERVRASLRELPAATRQALAEELIRIKRENYWEINERRINMDYVAEPQREKLREFFASLDAEETC